MGTRRGAVIAVVCCVDTAVAAGALGWGLRNTPPPPGNNKDCGATVCFHRSEGCGVAYYCLSLQGGAILLLLL